MPGIRLGELKRTTLPFGKTSCSTHRPFPHATLSPSRRHRAHLAVVAPALARDAYPLEFHSRARRNPGPPLLGRRQVAPRANDHARRARAPRPAGSSAPPPLASSPLPSASPPLASW